MPKTYTAAGSATAGDVYTAAAHNIIVTTINNVVVPAICIARRAATQSIATGSSTNVSFDTQDVDTDDMFTATSTDVTIKTAGVYIVSGFISWATQSGGVRFMDVTVNATAVAGQTYGSVLGTDAVRQSATTIVSLAVNDVVRLSCVQNSGSSINVTGRLSVAWAGNAS